MDMELALLHAIQNIRTDFLDKLMVAVSTIMGNYGQIWVVVGILLVIFKKTRKCGITLLTSYALVFLIGNIGLKNWVARPRPYQVDNTVELLVKKSSSYSFPSVHTAWAFAAVTSITMYFKKTGFATCLLAILVAFSRLYLFVHFFSDVTAGLLLGMVLAFISSAIVEYIYKKFIDKDETKITNGEVETAETVEVSDSVETVILSKAEDAQENEETENKEESQG